MAERYRKGSKERAVLNCTVTAEAKAYLKQLANEFGLGHAIELLVDAHRRRQKHNRILHPTPK